MNLPAAQFLVDISHTIIIKICCRTAKRQPKRVEKMDIEKLT
jgi:hypothetical protein